MNPKKNWIRLYSRISIGMNRNNVFNLTQSETSARVNHIKIFNMSIRDFLFKWIRAEFIICLSSRLSIWWIRTVYTSTQFKSCHPNESELRLESIRLNLRFQPEWITSKFSICRSETSDSNESEQSSESETSVRMNPKNF